MYGRLVRDFPLLYWLTLLTLATDDNAKPIAAKYLTKWRPGFAERLNGPAEEESKTNGAEEAAS